MSRLPQRWDLFCRVVDNYGDIGVCWRLAADLAQRGEQVRLWVDDASALAWMAPGGAPGVQVQPWADPLPAAEPGDVVVEAFGCDPPAAFVERMARRATPPVWVNLEYLSAEPYVERSHGLASPQRNGLTKWFFYPGFTPRTGGLLREPGLAAVMAGFDRVAWLSRLGISLRAGERVVSLFCYANNALPGLLNALSDTPTLILATPGHAQGQLQALALPPRLRVAHLPWLTQADFDRLLWSADLNFVRGEDSLVRALWAGKPFVWQIYPQHDGAHGAKLDAFLATFSASGEPAFEAALHRLWHTWNGLAAAGIALPNRGAWEQVALAWRRQTAAQTDLATQLIGFVGGKCK